MNKHSIEVGQQITIDGRVYWISKVSGETLELMPDPDNLLGRNKAPSFWPVFWLIVLIIVLIKLVF